MSGHTYDAAYYARNAERINARKRAKRANMTEAEREAWRARQKVYNHRARARRLGVSVEELDRRDDTRLDRLAKQRRLLGEKPEGMSEYAWRLKNMTEAEREAFLARRRGYARKYMREHREAKSKERPDAMRCVEAISLDELARAKTKPANCSAVRWRMELSRRRMSRACTGKLPYYLPDPDALGRGGRIAGMPMA